MKSFSLKKGDIAVVAVLLCISAVIFLGINFFSSQGSEVKIEVDSKAVAALPLNENTIYNVEKNGKITNIVEIKDKSVSVISADCPDKICLHHRKISKSGESIICLPNKVVISIEGKNEEVDGVAR